MFFLFDPMEKVGATKLRPSFPCRFSFVHKQKRDHAAMASVGEHEELPVSEGLEVL
jgi:hypothetical protein